MPWLQEGGQVRLVGCASMDGFVSVFVGVSVYVVDGSISQSSFQGYCNKE